MGNNFQCCTDPQECQDDKAKEIVHYNVDEEAPILQLHLTTPAEQVTAGNVSPADSVSLSYSPSNETTTTTDINWDLESVQTVHISGCSTDVPASNVVTRPSLDHSDELTTTTGQKRKKGASRTASSSSLWTPLKSGSSASITVRSDQLKSVGQSVTSGAPVTKSTQRTVNSADKPTIKSLRSTGGGKSVQGNSSSKSKGKTASQSSENSNALDGASSVAEEPGRANWPCVGIHAYYHPHYPRQGASPTSLSPSTPAVSPSHNELSGSPSVEKSVRPPVNGTPTATTPEYPPSQSRMQHPARKLVFSPPRHSPEAPPVVVIKRPTASSTPSKAATAPPTSRRLSTDKESPHKETISHKLAFLHQRQPWKG